MSDRPTPEEIVDFTIDDHSETESLRPEHILDALAAHGYRIVHPDDVPERDVRGDHHDTAQERARGWNACRALVFGGER